MSWQEVTPINAKTAKGLVAYRYGKRGGAGVLIPASVGEALKWKAGVKLSLYVGGGEHVGRLKLVPDVKGPLTVRVSKASSLQVHIGKLAQLPEREVKRVTVRHECDELGVLVIALPAHALAIAPEKTVNVSISSGKVDVSDKIVGGGPRPPRYATASGTRG